MEDLKLSLKQDYDAILGTEYCSGYMDALGKWNTGFYCPSSDETIDVFCCGSFFHKYCCTKSDQVLQTEVENLTVFIGILVGAATALLLITMVSCFCCSCCPLYKKRNPASSKYRGSMNRPHNQENSSSGMTRICSGSNEASGSISPLSSSHGRVALEDHIQLIQHGMSHSYTLPHNLCHHHSFRQALQEENENESSGRQYGTLGRLPGELPPFYHILPRASYLVLPQNPPDLLNESRMHQDVGIQSISGEFTTSP